jgi:hypothetical protein
MAGSRRHPSWRRPAPTAAQCTAAGWRQKTLCCGARTGMAAGTDCREAGPDFAGFAAGVEGARARRELLRGVALSSARRRHVQKKACMHPSRIAPTSEGGVIAGRGIRQSSIRRGLSSLTSPGAVLRRHSPILYQFGHRRRPHRSFWRSRCRRNNAARCRPFPFRVPDR